MVRLNTLNGKSIFAAILSLKLFPAIDTNADKKTFLSQFWQSVDAILEDVSVAETIVQCWTITFQTIIIQCSKITIAPVTRLKVAPNMADPIYFKN